MYFDVCKIYRKSKTKLKYHNIIFKKHEVFLLFPVSVVMNM